VGTRPDALTSGATRSDILTDVAKRYYLQDQSQIEIARELRLAPSTVSRYLQRARDEGIVYVEIRPPRREHVDLGRTVAARFGLSRVVVAGETGHPGSLTSVAADFIDGLMRSGLRLGVSWGRTLADVVHHLPPGSVAGLVIAQLAGGLDEGHPGIQGHELVSELADLFPGSRVSYIHAPAIVGSVAARRTLAADPGIAAALDAAAQSEVALVGIGQMEGGTLVEGQHVALKDWHQLKAAGAVGNVNTRFFDAQGCPIAHLERRTIAIEWKELRAIPTVVAVAAGTEKKAAISGALRTGCIDVLVTDELTATTLLAD